MARNAGNWLKTYMSYTCHAEAPPNFRFWTGVSVVAAALRRKVWIDMEYFQWTPNFYIILIAPPGILTKSTTLDVGKGFLHDIKSIRFGPAALTWQAMISSLENAAEIVTMPDGSFYPMSCLSFYVSELGTLLDPTDRKLIDVLVDLWDGKRGVWEKATATMGSAKAINPWLNIAAGTTPAWLADNLPRVMLTGGFVSRCVFVFGSEKSTLIAYPQRQVTPATQQLLKGQLLHDLEEIAMLKGPFTMTEEAYVYGEEWYAEHYAVLKANKDRPELSGYLARKQSHAHKLAMVLSAAEDSSLQIKSHHLSEALSILAAVEVDLPEVYKHITTTSEMEKVAQLINEVRRKGKIERSILYQLFVHTLSWKAFEDALSAAVNSGYVQLNITPQGAFIEWRGLCIVPVVADTARNNGGKVAVP